MLLFYKRREFFRSIKFIFNGSKIFLVAIEHLGSIEVNYLGDSFEPSSLYLSLSLSLLSKLESWNFYHGIYSLTESKN